MFTISIPPTQFVEIPCEDGEDSHIYVRMQDISAISIEGVRHAYLYANGCEGAFVISRRDALTLLKSIGFVTVGELED